MPIFIPRLSEWQSLAEQETELAERLTRARRLVWAGCYVVGFGSGLLTANVLRPAAPTRKATTVKKAAAAKKGTAVKKALPAAAAAVKDPVVLIREVKR